MLRYEAGHRYVTAQPLLLPSDCITQKACVQDAPVQAEAVTEPAQDTPVEAETGDSVMAEAVPDAAEVPATGEPSEAPILSSKCTIAADL